jgi:hypothetical protein
VHTPGSAGSSSLAELGRLGENRDDRYALTAFGIAPDAAALA